MHENYSGWSEKEIYQKHKDDVDKDIQASDELLDNLKEVYKEDRALTEQDDPATDPRVAKEVEKVGATGEAIDSLYGELKRALIANYPG